MRSLTAGLVVVLTSVLPSNVSAQQPAGRARGVPLDTVWQEAPALFPVLVAPPRAFDSTRAYPTIVALHGFASTAKAFARIAPTFTDAGFIVIIPEAPYPVPEEEAGTEYSWGLNRWTPPPLTNDSILDLRSSSLTVFEYVPAAVRSVEDRYRLGPCYVLGFSQGAIYAFLAAFYNRDVFDGVVTFGLAGMVPFWFSQRGGGIEDGRGLPVLLVHGREDRLNPFSESERARDMLQAAGYRVTLQLFEGGHSVPADQLPKVVAWLRSLR